MANEYPAHLVHATSAVTGGKLYLKATSSAVGSSNSNTGGSVLYCTAIDGGKGKPDTWRCWESMPLNTEADGYVDYSERPSNALTGWDA